MIFILLYSYIYLPFVHINIAVYLCMCQYLLDVENVYMFIQTTVYKSIHLLLCVQLYNDN